MFSQPRRINVPPERRGIGVVFQDYAVWPHMTVLENVSYPMKKRKMSKSEIKTRAENALKQVRMSEYANYLPVSFQEVSSSEWPSPEHWSAQMM